MTKDDASGESTLRREIGLFLGVLIVINSTIGTGIFKTPAKVARLAGSMSASVFVWILGGVIALAGALSLAELSAAIPRTGGLYEYLRRAYGPGVAFLFGWTKLTLLMPSAVGSFAKLAAEAIASLAGLPPDARRESVIAVLVLVVCASINLAGVRTSAIGQAVITGMKYAGVAFLAIAGVALPVAAGWSVPAPPDPPSYATAVTFAGVFGALVSVMWAYDGWADLSSLTGEVRKPERNLPLALGLGTLAIVVVYLAAIAGYASSLGLDGLRNSTTGTSMAASNLAFATLGAIGRRLLSALVLVSCVGGCMSSLLTGSRIFVPMSTDGVFVRAIGRVNARTHVPSTAVLVGAALGVVYVSFRSFEQLTEAFVAGYFPFYMGAVAAVYVLRRKEADLPRPFRVPLYPLLPAVFLAGAALLLIGAARDVDRTALFAFGVVALGAPVGWIWRRRQSPKIG